jgi:thioredoxin-like negative regulator of GroEL
MVERLLLVIAVGFVGFMAYRWTTRRQLQAAARHVERDPLLASANLMLPTVVYFTTPECAPCRLQQSPIFEQLQAESGLFGLQVVRVDATQNPEAARRWRVFSVPTTFVLDSHGQPRFVHNGVVDAQTLKRELDIQ